MIMETKDAIIGSTLSVLNWRNSALVILIVP